MKKILSYIFVFVMLFSSVAITNTSVVIASNTEGLTQFKFDVGQGSFDRSVSIANSVVRVQSGVYTLQINGQVSSRMNVAPFILNDRLMIPVTYVAQAFGISPTDIIWDGSNRAVTIYYHGRIIRLVIGSNHMIINGAYTSMGTSAIIRDGRTFIPMRFLAMALDFTTEWDAQERIATFTKDRQDRSGGVPNYNIGDIVEVTGVLRSGLNRGAISRTLYIELSRPLEMTWQSDRNVVRINNVIIGTYFVDIVTLEKIDGDDPLLDHLYREYEGRTITVSGTIRSSSRNVMNIDNIRHR